MRGDGGGVTCNTYSPSHSSYGEEEYSDDLDDFLITYNSNDYVHVVLCGDFHAHTLT